MDRRTALNALVVLLFVLALAMGCEAQGKSVRESVQPVAGEAPGGSFTEVILRIEGMTWFAWPVVVKRALEGLDGVEKAEVSLSRGEARVTYDPDKTAIGDMIQRVADAGFTASVLAETK